VLGFEPTTYGYEGECSRYTHYTHYIQRPIDLRGNVLPHVLVDMSYIPIEHSLLGLLKILQTLGYKD